MKSQRLVSDIAVAPLGTNGESGVSTGAVRSFAPMDAINLSGGSWFGTSCMLCARASAGPEPLRQWLRQDLSAYSPASSMRKNYIFFALFCAALCETRLWQERKHGIHNAGRVRNHRVRGLAKI